MQRKKIIIPVIQVFKLNSLGQTHIEGGPADNEVLIVERLLYYRIAGNFRPDKIFAFFAHAWSGQKFFTRIFSPVKILSH